MSCLGCSCFITTTTTTAKATRPTTNLVLASLINNNNNNNNNNIPLPPPRKLGNHSKKPAPLTIPPSSKQRQPSVTEVERAIGAGIFRDRDPSSIGENPTLFDTLLSSTIGRTEGSVEKKLRETGEWLIDSTESPAARSTGEQILLVVCLWVLPVWLFSFLIASGLFKLPFSVPFLDDLIM